MATRPKVLIVDDVEENRKLLEALLAPYGFELVQANGGEAALASCRDGPPDLVLLDLVMPDLDGFSVLDELKSDPKTRDVPVIIISSLDDIGTVVRCIDHGADDHLPKPIEPSLLRIRVSACLERKKLREQELSLSHGMSKLEATAMKIEAGAYTTGDLDELALEDSPCGHLARVLDKLARTVSEREAESHQTLQRLRYDLRPCPSYRGHDSFVFVCYAHEDVGTVYADIAWMDEQGMRVWYDEGISIGARWTDELASAIHRCSGFAFFASSSSVASNHCVNEVNFAVELDKPFYSIYIEDISLPDGLQLVMGPKQAIFRHKLPPTTYRSRLLELFESLR